MRRFTHGRNGNNRRGHFYQGSFRFLFLNCRGSFRNRMSRDNRRLNLFDDRRHGRYRRSRSRNGLSYGRRGRRHWSNDRRSSHRRGRNCNRGRDNCSR
jgi:hypothetical protein